MYYKTINDGTIVLCFQKSSYKISVSVKGLEPSSAATPFYLLGNRSMDLAKEKETWERCLFFA